METHQRIKLLKRVDDPRNTNRRECGGLKMKMGWVFYVFQCCHRWRKSKKWAVKHNFQGVILQAEHLLEWQHSSSLEILLAYLNW